MLLYLDTSALLKLYVNEDGSRLVANRVQKATTVLTSAVAYAEARAALGRLQREGVLTRDQTNRSKRALEADWPHLVVLDATERLARRAGALAERHSLRGFDAIHLASALDAEDLLGRPVAFLSFDQRQNRAAEAEGVLPADPQSGREPE